SPPARMSLGGRRPDGIRFGGVEHGGLGLPGPILEQSDEIIIYRRNHDPKSLGKQNSAERLPSGHPQSQGRFQLAAGDGLDSSAVIFSFVSRVIETQAKNRGHKSAESNPNIGQSVINQIELDQEGR